MRVLRTAGDVLVGVLAVLGVLSVVLWAAGALGLVKPLVVVSGSMEPQIMTGDLLLATPVPVDEVEVGDVASLPNPVTGTLVTHRVIDVAQQPDGTWHVHMQGDANDSPDAGAYVVGDGTVLVPQWQVSGVGRWLGALTAPGTAVPLLVALAALLALSLLPRAPGPTPAPPPIADHSLANQEAACSPVASSRSQPPR